MCEFLKKIKLNNPNFKVVEFDQFKKTPETNFDINYLKEMLKERIENVNFIDVKKEDLSFYSKDLFFQMIDKL